MRQTNEEARRLLHIGEQLAAVQRAPNAKKERLLRLPEVISRTGLSRSAVYQYMDEGRFPRSIPLGSAWRRGWIESEVQGWINNTITNARRPLGDDERLALEILGEHPEGLSDADWEREFIKRKGSNG